MEDNELIRQVAEEVMGWQEWSAMGNPFWMVDQDTLALPLGHDFDPLTNANHWLMVVERMRELGYSVTIEMFKHNWIVSFFRTTYFNAKRAYNEILGHAICEAALKAVKHG